MKTTELNQLRLLEAVPMWEWPEHAGQWIRAGLDGDDELREAAVHLAHNVMDDDLARVMLRLLRTDPVAEIAGAAAIALGPALEECDIEYADDLGGLEFLEEEMALSRPMFTEVCEALEAMFHDADRPELVRRRVLEAAVRAPQEWLAGAVRASYQSEDYQWQATAVFCMGWIPGFDDSILEALGSADERVRREALVAAGSRELQAAGLEVLGVAGDEEENRNLRLAAIKALELLTPPGSQELLEDLSGDGDEEIAGAVEEALEERAMFAGLEGLNDDEGWVDELDEDSGDYN